MSVGLSIDQQYKEYMRSVGSPAGQPASYPAGNSIDQQYEEYMRENIDPTFSTGPAAGFTEPSAAARLDKPRTPATATPKQFREASRLVAQKILGTSDQLTTGERHAQSLFTGIMSGVADVAGLGIRAAQAVGVDTPVSSNQWLRAIQDLEAQANQNANKSMWHRGLRSAARSMTFQAAGQTLTKGKLGYKGMLGLFGALRANSAVEEADTAGLTGAKAAGYVAAQTINEIGMTYLGGKMFGKGTEGLFSGVKEGTWKGLTHALKAVGKTTLAELGEENLVEVADAIISKSMDVDEKSWGETSVEDWVNLVKETSLSTLLSAGTMGTTQQAAARIMVDEDTQKARELAQKEKLLTRRDMQEMGYSGPTSAAERAEFKEAVTEALADKDAGKPEPEVDLEPLPQPTAYQDPETSEWISGDVEQVQAPELAMRPDQFEEGGLGATEESRQAVEEGLPRARAEVASEAEEAAAPAVVSEQEQARRDRWKKVFEERRARAEADDQELEPPAKPDDLDVGDRIILEDTGESREILGMEEGEQPLSKGQKRRGKKPRTKLYFETVDGTGQKERISEGAVGQYIKKAEAEAEAAPETETAPKATPVEDMSKAELARENKRLSNLGFVTDHFGDMTIGEKKVALKKTQIKEEAERLEIKGRDKMSDEELSDAVSAAQQDEQSRRDAVPKVLQDAEPGAVVVEVLPGRGLTGDTDERSAQRRSEKWVVKAGENLGIKVRIMDAEGEGALNTPAMLDTSTGDIWISRQYLNQREHAHRSKSRSRKSLERYMKRLVFHEWIHSLKRTHPDLYKEIMAVVRNSKFSQQHSQASAEYLENSRPLTQEEIDEGVVDTSNPAFWKRYNSLDATEQQELLEEEGLATLAEDMSEKWGLFSALNSEDTGLFDRLRDWFRRTYQGVFKQNKLYKEIYSAMESASKEPATATTEDGGPVFAARREPDVALSARQVTEEVCGTCFSDVGSVFLIETRGREQYDPSIVGLIDKVGLENLVYVHGNAMVTDPATGETRLGGHAWIEAKGDQGWVVWDPEHKKVFDRDLYYKQAGAVPEIQYTDTDIALLTMKTQNHGPWYDEELFSGRGEPLGRPHPQSSAPPRFAARREPDAIPGSDKQGVTVLPEGQLLIHGTTRAAYEDIGESGTVVAGEKVSGGTIEEKGLIWLTDHRGTAEGFARGIEHHKDEPRPETGGVVTVRLPREMRIIDREQELTEEQAKILNELNPRRSYDPIKEGTTISSAMWKLVQWEGDDAPKTLVEVLPLIGFEGIRYDGGIGPNQFGVIAESLPVVDRQPVPPPPTFAARRRSSAAKLRQSEHVITEGSGDNRKVLVRDVGKLLMDDHMGRFGRKFDPMDDEDMRQAVLLAADEINYQMQQVETGAEWYDKDIAASMEYSSVLFEELGVNPYSQYMMNIIAANLSPQTYASQNWDKALRAYESFRETGTIPHRNPANRKLWAGTTGPNIAKSLRLLNHMHSEMGLEGLADWLLEPHTLRELAELRRDSGVYSKTRIVRTDEIRALEKRVTALRKMDPEKKGLRTAAQEDELKEKRSKLSELKRKAKREVKSVGDFKPVKGKLTDLFMGPYIFGPKVGPFFLNVSGFDADTTADIWFTRMYMRHHGLLTDEQYLPAGDGDKTGLVDAPPETLRARMKEFNRAVALQTGMTERRAQSVLWFFEQQLYNGLGTKTRSEKFSDGAKKVLRDRGLDPDAERDRIRRSRAGQTRGILGKVRRRSKRAEERARAADVKFAARRRNVSQGIRTPPSPMPTRPERGLGPVEHDPLRASARQRLQTNFEEEEQAMLAWGENPHALDAEDTYVWRGILEARALESLDAGDEESLRRNQALQLAWDEAGTYWAMGGHARQNQFQETPEEEAFHELVNKLTGPSERSKARVKKIRGTQNKQAAAEAEAQGRLDTAQQEADEQAAIAEEAEQLAATTDDKALKRDATAEAKDARTQERGARGRAARATTDRDRARTQKNRSRERVHKALASDGKKALEAQKQLQAAGYDTSQEGLREIAADPVDHARAKVITGTAREISWVDRLLSIRRNAMLSGIKTQAVNMFGPLLYTGQQQLPLILEAGLHHATGGRVGQMGFPALTRLWSGFYAHLGAASTNALTSFRTGTQFFESEVMKKAGSSRAEAPNQAWGGLVGWGVETPQRLLGATDDFYKTVLTLSYLDAYGYQKFRNEGQTHEEAVGSMADVLEDPTNELWDEALVEAQRLTFTSRIDLAPLNLLRKMRQGDPNYLKGKWKDARIPFQIVSQTIVPFQDTPVNILAEGIKQTPAGLLMQIPGAINAAKDGDWSKVTSRSAQSLVGTMIGLALYNWVLGDDEEYPLITGTDIEHSPEKRELYNRRGMPQPQSFRIGDGWYSYERLDPLSTTLSLMVDAINASRRGDAGAEDLAAVAGQSLMRASLDKTFFSGISDIAEAIRRSLDVRPGEEEGSAVSRGIHHWGIGYATSWVPSLVKHYNQANQESYPERGLWGKEPEFGDRAMRRYAQRAEMGLAEDRPRIALFGEPIPRHTPFSNPAVDWAWRFASPIRAKAHDPFVGNRIIMNWNRQNPKAQLNPRSPRYIRIKDTTIYLTDEQLEDYARLGGGNARKIIEYVESQNGFDDPANPTLKDKEIVKRAVERGYRQARMALVPQWNQDHAITDKILDRRVETGKMTPAQVQEYKSTRQTRQYVSP